LIWIVIADDHPIFRDGLRELLTIPHRKAVPALVGRSGRSRPLFSLRFFGWITFVVMLAAAVGMLVTS
jgi:hypothetical protein